MQRFTVLILAIAVTMALALAACGTEEDPTATPAPAEPTATTAADMSDDDMDDEDDMSEDDMDDEDDMSEDDMDDNMSDDDMMKETIIFSDLNWDSAQVQNRIAQYVLEKGYGYPTDVIFGGTLPLLEGLERGDQHVTMEIWLPNQTAAWTNALASGVVTQVGYSLGRDWQSAFVIPAYLQAEYPELDSVEDLKDQQYKDLFTTVESGDKASLLSCVIGWACEQINDAQVVGYGLTDHVHVVKPGDGAALNADLEGAYQRQEPWLGYQWGTNTPALVLDLVRLEEPAYNAECWAIMQAYADGGPPPAEGCGYEDAEIVIAVRSELTESAPEIIDFFENWGFNISEYGKVAQFRQDNPNADIADAAQWYLANHQDTWTPWVTADAADDIKAALAANEIPDGWPTE